MISDENNARRIVRRSKLYIPVNREKFVDKAWIREADCIILDLEDSIAPADKASARKLVKDVIPVVNKGGADILVRINREYEKAGVTIRNRIYYEKCYFRQIEKPSIFCNSRG